MKLKTFFSDGDPAGIIYFARIADLAHRAFELHLEKLKIQRSAWFEDPRFIVPIRHMEADYFAPIPAGSTLDARVRVSMNGTSSLTVETRFFLSRRLAAQVTTVHVFVNNKTGKKQSVPPAFKRVLGP